MALIREDWDHNERRWTKPGLHALVAYRIGHWVERRADRWAGRLAKPVALLIAWVVRHRFDIEVSPAAWIGRRVEIGHQGGIRIGAGVVLGNDCVLHQGVRIVPRDEGEGEDGIRAPRVGSDVDVGPRAVILGPVEVGDGARIGPVALITEDVPPKVSAIAPPSAVTRPSATT